MAVVKLGKPVKSNLGGPNGAMAYIIDPAQDRRRKTGQLQLRADRNGLRRAG